MLLLRLALMGPADVDFTLQSDPAQALDARLSMKGVSTLAIESGWPEPVRSPTSWPPERLEPESTGSVTSVGVCIPPFEGDGKPSEFQVPNPRMTPVVVGAVVLSLLVCRCKESEVR